MNKRWTKDELVIQSNEMENWISDEYNIDRKWAGDEVVLMKWRWLEDELAMNRLWTGHKDAQVIQI